MRKRQSSKYKLKSSNWREWAGAQLRKRVISNLKFELCTLKFAFSFLIVAIVFMTSSVSWAAPPGPSEREVDDSIVRALRYLAQRQQPAGGWNVDAFGGEATSATSLSVMAFLAAGHTPGEGPYGEAINRGVQFVLDHQEANGLLIHRRGHGPMYDHGISTLMLAEVSGMVPEHQSATSRRALERAIRLIIASQLIGKPGNQTGGWRYQPVPYDADISVTICQIMALRAARDAGLKVEKDVIDKAVEYVKRCQNTDGGFSYVAGQGSGSGFARSGAGVASLYYAGIFEGDNLKRGLDYLKQYTPGKGGGPEMDGHYYYGNYYAVQAMFLAGGDYWAQWYPAIREQLIARQGAQGNWSGDGAGDDYATSLALIILQMPNRYLPVFNGKGPGS